MTFLRHKQEGDYITHAEFNAIIDALKLDVSLPHGEKQPGMLGLSSFNESELHIACLAAEAIPAYSVFSITTPEADINLPHAKAKRLGRLTSSSPFTLATNGPFAIAADDKFSAQIIGALHSTIVQVDPADIPGVGHSCGVQFEQLRVGTKNCFGLLCVSEVFTRDGIQLIRVLRATNNIGIVGKVTEVVTAAAGDTLGRGKIEVHYRNADTHVIMPATAPNAGGVWTLDVYNIYPITYSVGDIVQIDGKTGIGLCVEGGGGGGIIEYKITSTVVSTSGPYIGLKIATVTIHGAPCGRESLIGTSAEVVDHSNELFDEISMVGFTGWAAEMVFLSLDSTAPCGTMSPCHWAAINRVCSPNTGLYDEPCPPE